jgi:hypothetical protein
LLLLRMGLQPLWWIQHLLMRQLLMLHRLHRMGLGDLNGKVKVEVVEPPTSVLQLLLKFPAAGNWNPADAGFQPLESSVRLLHGTPPPPLSLFLVTGK